jgi:nucleoid-associated protein YgaU
MQLRKPLSLILIVMLLFSTSVFLLPAESALAGNEPTFESSLGQEEMGDAVTFLVRIENISGDSDLATPFAPGVWVLHSEAGPIFTTGEADRGYGLEALAEDGDPANLLDALSGMDLHAGVFNTPAGADGPGPLLPGGAYEFEVKATPDTPYLSFATMFVQSNDLFIGPGEAGIALFDMDGMAMMGMQDVTAEMQLWDAGTEANEEPGVGGDQAPRQAAANTGLPEIEGTVRVVDDSYTYPDVSALVKVTITEVMMMDEGMGEKDEMMADKDDEMADKDGMMSDKDGMMAAEIMLMEEGSTAYTVVAGDTLGSISRRAYGSSKYWSVICSDNSLENCNLIQVGDELMLPSEAEAMSMMDDKMMMGEKDGMMEEKDDMMADKDDMESDKDDMMADDAMMMEKIELVEEGFTPYTVVAGDTLGSIALRAYGESRYWGAICVNNSEVTEDCNRIQIGDELMLPSQTDADLFFDEVDAMGPDMDSDEMEKKSDE